ncbi:MAG: hypothetical protein J6Q63_05125 [Bacteroidales bacterium]|nr:hypothetical protein [Bacteroidales bacterium]
MKSYSKSNLQQCVRNLFAQARYEYGKAARNGLSFPKTFSLWDNDSDCFYAVALETLSTSAGGLMIEFTVYVKHSEYICSRVVGSARTAEGVLEWLNDTASLKKCLEAVDTMIGNID